MTKQKIIPKGYFLFLLPLVIIGLLTSIVLINQNFSQIKFLKIKPNICESGRLSDINDDEFVEAYITGNNNFHDQIKQSLKNIRSQGQDYNLISILYTGGKVISTDQPYFFLSVNQKKLVTTDGSNIKFTDIEPNAAMRPVIDEDKFDSLLSPVEAVKIAKPILNCYKDYSEKISREAYLLAKDRTSNPIWIITAKEFLPTIPGPNPTHSVTIDAFTGTILKYD